MRNFRKAPPVPSRTSTSQLALDPLKKLPSIQQQQPQCSQAPYTPQKYHVTQLDLMRPVKTKTETISRDIITSCLKVLEDIGVEVREISVDGILNGRLKCILGLFFNLSKFKQKLRECHSQTKNQIPTSIPRNSTESSNTSTSLDSPDSDKRYVTPPSSVQSSIQYQSRPLSDPQVLKKPLESKSRLPVLRQSRYK
ncbi:hypothetical protein Aperf_G00000119967 [Anoplocephala perfoliata]